MIIKEKKCPFCFYQTHEIVYESHNFCIIKDKYPTKKGHLLIIPKSHIRSEEELDQTASIEFALVRKKAFYWIRKNYKQDPFIFVNGRESMTIFHMHWHYIPCKWLKPIANKNGLYTHGIAKAFELYKKYIRERPHVTHTA